MENGHHSLRLNESYSKVNGEDVVIIYKYQNPFKNQKTPSCTAIAIKRKAKTLKLRIALSESFGTKKGVMMFVI